IRGIVFLSLGAVAVLILAHPIKADPGTDGSAQERATTNARILTISSDQAAIDVAAIDKTFPTHIAVKDPDLKGRVKGFQVGDHVDLTVGSEALPVLHSIAPSLVSLSAQGRLSWLCAATVSFVLIYLLAWSIGRLIAKKPLRLLQPLIGQDGRYSNST